MPDSEDVQMMMDETGNRTPLSARDVVAVFVVIQFDIERAEEIGRIGEDARLQPTAVSTASAKYIVVEKSEKILAEFIANPATFALSCRVVEMDDVHPAFRIAYYRDSVQKKIGRQHFLCLRNRYRPFGDLFEELHIFFYQFDPISTYIIMNQQMRVDREPYYRSRSTLLIPETLFRRFFWRSPHIKIGHWTLASYLGRLMDDPQLDYKLSFLEKTGKWKKQYQEEGQALVRVKFYPDDRDWGRLSAISNATGYSRCYIFVYLLLIALRVISLELEDGGTLPIGKKGHWNSVVICFISVDAATREIMRVLQT